MFFPKPSLKSIPVALIVATQREAKEGTTLSLHKHFRNPQFLPPWSRDPEGVINPLPVITQGLRANVYTRYKYLKRISHHVGFEQKVHERGNFLVKCWDCCPNLQAWVSHWHLLGDTCQDCTQRNPDKKGRVIPKDIWCNNSGVLIEFLLITSRFQRKVALPLWRRPRWHSETHFTATKAQICANISMHDSWPWPLWCNITVCWCGQSVTSLAFCCLYKPTIARAWGSACPFRQREDFMLNTRVRAHTHTNQKFTR